MNAAKRRFNGIGLLLLKLFRPMEGKTWNVAATLVFLAILGITTFYLWQNYGHRVLGHSRYRLDPEKLFVTPKPDWIRSDVVANAVTHGRLAQASLLDKEVVLQVEQAFGVQPWVKRVTRVNKLFPSTVEVQLEYRRPVALVEVPAGTFPPHDYKGMVPIDEEGYLLPVEMTREEAYDFPKIGGVQTSPAGPPGTPWGDARVSHAARIVVLLEEIWHDLRLRRVDVPVSNPIDATTQQSYVLVTQGRNLFSWGSAPGHEQPGEDSANDKVGLLRNLLKNHGSLDDYRAATDIQSDDQVDLRHATRWLRHPSSRAPSRN